MKIIKNPSMLDWPNLLKRPTLPPLNIERTTQDIFLDIQHNGDAAIAKYTFRFDGIELQNFEVSTYEVETACLNVPEHLKTAIRAAKKNIETFHKAQITERIEIETTDGVLCWQEKRPIDQVGFYIPGGTAPLFSTVLMLAIPATIAGCKEIVLCSPPNKNGALADEILYTAQLCGITKIFKVGGIQAIAGMIFGTNQIPKVYKIFGPGNQYVTAAKKLAMNYGVAIDMPAGPSELLILADDSANAKYIAADLLSQAEHGEDSQVVLISPSETLLEIVKHEIYSQLEALPRKAIALKVLENSKIIALKNQKTTLDLINAYAPEHLIVCVKNPEAILDKINNAGSVFLGNFTPESAGDYASGTNHTLPTNGFSKSFSGVNLDSFTKSITFQRISGKGLMNIGPTVQIMAEAEGLFAHKNAVTIRLNDLLK